MARDVHINKERGVQIGWAPWSVRFWRCMAITFCVFSVVGHWMEIPYCLFMDWAFQIVDDESLVFADPMYPFLVYGIAAVLCALILIPLREWLIANHPPIRRAVVEFFILAAFSAMAGELIMGWMLNRPDPYTGLYPLWDNSNLPGNVFDQAWIVNDILLGALVTMYVWLLYPALVKLVSLVPREWGWPVTTVVVLSFVTLCVIKF